MSACKSRAEDVKKNLEARGLLDDAKKIAKIFYVTIDDLLGPTRPKSVMAARKVLYRSFLDKGLSLPEVGKALKRDHTTILKGLRSGGTTEQVMTAETMSLQ